MAMFEREMEQCLINQLCHGVSQWTYRPDIKNEADLWNNIRDKLNQNNISALDGIPITDNEMDQIKEFIRDQAETTFKAARWLAGEHRIAQIPLKREDAAKGTVSLLAVNNREIAGGSSSYEVINQYSSTIEKSGGSRDRRFDVTLLINGFPLIHIELKNHDHPYMDAFRQIKKYCEEGKFRGLWGLIQMFVVSNGSQTRYIAANNRGNLNPNFLMRWVNKQNEAIEDYLAFAKEALRIPAAHYMIGRFSVLDNERKNVILLRPYQIHAIEAISQASRERKPGYIWHTTGSGKTLTSYTVTKILLDIPSVDKTIFLIDRKDLDKQTSDSFKSYADSDDIDVQNTDKTADLEKKLVNKDRVAIVTTIQKLQTIINRCTTKDLSEKYQALSKKLKPKNIAFVVDECHRAVTPETKRIIEHFFNRSLWYGFTGTPIFAENKRTRMGDLPRTTDELYGACLHKYTIKEALADGAVLGFQIQNMGHSEDDFKKIAVKMKLYDENSVENVPAIKIEQQVIEQYKRDKKQSFYDSDEHRNNVIDYIINKCTQKLHLNAPEGQSYEGLLTVPSIEVAQHYYKLIKEFIANGKVSEKIKRLLPDFPKIAITYTVGENEDGATANQKEMQQSLNDYNAMFGTNWDLSTLNAYNADLNDRLARKKSKYQNRSEQLDLVIVVDRLLTGFDAPCMSTIFLDREPMKPQHLIQAFSRTNRIFDKSKRYGQIITMQTPATYAKDIDDALLLYSNGGTIDVTAPTWEEVLQKFKETFKHLKQIAPSPEQAKELFTAKDSLKAFVKAFQQLDRLFGEIQVYDQFTEAVLIDIGFNREEFEEYVGVYHNAIEALKDPDGDDEPIPDIDIEYELESIKTTEINYRYITALIQSHIPFEQEKAQTVSPTEDKRISDYIEQYCKTNPQIGKVLRQIWFEIKFSPETFRNQDVISIVEQRVMSAIEKIIDEFAIKWSVNKEELKAFVINTPINDIKPATVNTEMGDFKAFKEKGGTGSKLIYLKQLRLAVVELATKQVKPLLKV
ncbi:type I restriction endonuclease subunit R [uncultured Succinatimonas sp.]|uniref:type I restriction endonuclease subunit R n=1 Tax=uncultured Succinatimonas sp. TaxID=1262973 RepID=UPI0025E18BB7|nr:type I restriction endonuclease subunit R [uncultured Succinatimonas sp.]